MLNQTSTASFSRAVKMQITPSEEIRQAAQAAVTVTDRRGRVIQLNKPGILSQYRLVEALGESAKNDVYMGMVLPLIFVVAIDEEPVLLPTTKAQVEALIAQLDEAGIAAVMEGVQQHYSQPDADAQKQAIKK
jgi:hypothetical protein